METWTDALRHYVIALRAAGRSSGTIRLHRHYLDGAARVIPSPWAASSDDLVALLAHEGWAPETRKSCRGALSSFYRWGHGTGRISSNPAASLPSVRVPAGRARPTPESVYLEALAGADRRGRLMLKLAALCGLRALEVATVHTRALEVDTLRVTGKGGRVRVVPVLDAELHQAISDAEGWLFPGRIDGHLSPGYVSRLLGELLPAGWTGHTLRHRYGTRAYAGTRDLLAVGELLGHARPETTRRYIALPDDAIRAAALAAAA
ncbi:tyrosine-type recombinase/integrase [Brachybacterium paraconglomeratum]|uniref:tyrosine-type recombinase/integrase n=1 Tax=Brachybacterium paraconglomeratum TaxID=173362 RepID=UPI0022AEC7D6|nr:tyrosine-type recombinase/integrase [Brachybacterium paraconglomeratum]MCZ4324750.1 tyrosine-type recombinase/integrase [Brachybacterium paraconglomeratum]